MDFVDITEWNAKIEKAFTEAKSRLPDYQKELKVITDVLTSKLTADERMHLQSRAEKLTETIDDLINDTSFGFYLLEVQEYIEKYISISGTSKRGISFMKKDRVVNDETQNLSRTFLSVVEKYNNILRLNIPKIGIVKKPLACDCGNSKDIDVVDERLYYCQKCGTELKEQIGSRNTFKDIERVNVSSKYKYSRMIHIQNCIRQYQGKQKVKIPPQLLRDVQEQLKLNGCKKINPQHIRSALQNTGWSDHYENFVLIWSIVTGNNCPDISELEDSILRDFELVEREYNTLMDNPQEERSSFMSYPYVLYQLLRKHGHRCDMNFFNMLKSDRIGWLDTIMGKIFDRLEWNGFEGLGE